MKVCAYVNCSNPVSGRKTYCKSSHKTRQWEINNGKANPVKKISKTKPDMARLSSQRDFVRDYREKMKAKPSQGFSRAPEKQYKSIYVDRKPTYSMTKILGGTALAYNVASGGLKKGKRKDTFNNTGKFLLWGLGFDIAYNFFMGDTTEILQELPVVEERPLASSPGTGWPLGSVAKATGSRISSLDYRQQNIDTIKFDRHYRNIIGVPPKNFYMLVHGQSGHGKSYWTIQFAEYFQRNHGKVLYYAAEQRGDNLAFQNMLNEIKATFAVEKEPRTISKKQIIEDAKTYDLLVFDSFNEMNFTPDDVKEIRQAGKAAIVGILQSTKDGQFKGDNTWLHDTDIMVELVNRIANSDQKGRYKHDTGKTINISGRTIEI